MLTWFLGILNHIGHVAKAPMEAPDWNKLICGFKVSLSDCETKLSALKDSVKIYLSGYLMPIHYRNTRRYFSELKWQTAINTVVNGYLKPKITKNGLLKYIQRSILFYGFVVQACASHPQTLSEL